MAGPNPSSIGYERDPITHPLPNRYCFKYPARERRRTRLAGSFVHSSQWDSNTNDHSVPHESIPGLPPSELPANGEINAGLSALRLAEVMRLISVSTPQPQTFPATHSFSTHQIPRNLADHFHQPDKIEVGTQRPAHAGLFLFWGNHHASFLRRDSRHRFTMHAICPQGSALVSRPRRSGPPRKKR